eukprot:21517-Prymnesium_polylepis.1
MDAAAALSSEEGAALGGTAVALRRSLHLNVAAAGLKQSDWQLAAAAADFVLKRVPGEPKALYRLAQARKGGGEPREAARLLRLLLSLDGQAANREARALLGTVLDGLRAERAA